MAVHILAQPGLSSSLPGQPLLHVWLILSLTSAAPPSLTGFSHP